MDEVAKVGTAKDTSVSCGQCLNGCALANDAASCAMDCASAPPPSTAPTSPPPSAAGCTMEEVEEVGTATDKTSAVVALLRRNQACGRCLMGCAIAKEATSCAMACTLGWAASAPALAALAAAAAAFAAAAAGGAAAAVETQVGIGLAAESAAREVARADGWWTAPARATLTPATLTPATATSGPAASADGVVAAPQRAVASVASVGAAVALGTAVALGAVFAGFKLFLSY